MSARLTIAAAVVAVAVIGAGAFMLKPVTGPPRDLTLAPNAERGAYIIRLGGCVSCHTDGDHGAMLAGGAPLQTKFGTFYPPNITPDKATGIGNWTLAQFSDALSNGHSPTRGNLYPVFPYDNFTLMTDQDIVDLYAGIMNRVKPVTSRVPDDRVIFPLNIRLLVSGWKNLFFSPHRFQPDPRHSDRWNRGAYLANGPGHCVSCHSPHNALGAVERDRAFDGSPTESAGGKTPPITAAALLSAGYTEETLSSTLKTGVTPSAGTVGDEMGEVVRDETSHWTDDDRAALSAYLLNRD